MSEVCLSEIWRERIENWKASGKSIAKWCHEQGIPDHRLYYWRRKFSDESTNRLNSTSQTGFSEIIARQPQSDLVIESKGFSIRINEGFDDETLLRCLRLLGRLT